MEAGSEQAALEVRVERNVLVPMSDGVRLAADVYLPEGDDPFPALLTRTPYNKDRDERAGATLRSGRIRGRGHGLARHPCIARGLAAVHDRGPGRIRHAGVGRETGVVQREDRHVWDFLSGIHTVASGALSGSVREGHRADRGAVGQLREHLVDERSLPPGARSELGDPAGSDRHRTDHARVDLDAGD